MRKKEYDKIFLLIIFIFLIVGIFILASASIGLLVKEGEKVRFSDILLRQFVLGLMPGLILLFITSRIHYKKWKKIALFFFLFSFLLTLAVFEKHIGFEYGGARRWLKIGSFSFQPSELLKFAFVVYLASWINTKQEDIKSFKFGLIPFLVIIAFVGIVLINQPNFGTLGVITITSLLMFVIGGGKLSQIAIIILLGLILIYIAMQFYPHVASRINVFLNPSLERKGIGYQIDQSLIAIGSGHIFGRGFGMSIQKFRYLPEPIGDSIFAVFGEEFGFLGSVLLISLFLFFLYRGFHIVLKNSDPFARLLGSGIIISITVQSFINIGSMIGILPLTGLPLTFISKGGSALLITLTQLGILLNISKNQIRV